MPEESTADADRAVRPGTDRLLCDAMLGTLTVYLRMCGYDAAYADDALDDAAVRALAEAEGRRLLSRDVSLVAGTPGGVLLTEREVADQLRELRSAGFELRLPDRPVRCGRCNGRLEAMPAGAPRPDYAPTPDEADCWRCVDCDQCFWRGSHWDRVGRVLEAVRS